MVRSKEHHSTTGGCERHGQLSVYHTCGRLRKEGSQHLATGKPRIVSRHADATESENDIVEEWRVIIGPKRLIDGCACS